jgi:hypothetical protein
MMVYITTHALNGSAQQPGAKIMSTITIKLAPDNFLGADEIMLTTERAESSKGQPVAVLVGGPNSGAAYGPSDCIPFADPNGPFAILGKLALARNTVAAAAMAADLRDDALVAKFIAL